MKVVIYGSRGLILHAPVIDLCIRRFKVRITEVVSGNMPHSPDVTGESWASQHCVPIRNFPVSSTSTKEMAKYADCGIGLWDGISAGTRHMTHCLEMKGKDAHVLSVSCYLLQTPGYSDTIYVDEDEDVIIQAGIHRDWVGKPLWKLMLHTEAATVEPYTRTLAAKLE